MATVKDLESAFLTIQEAAEILKVSEPTVWRWIDGGRLCAYRAGKRTIRIKAEDLAQILEPIGSVDGESTEDEEQTIFETMRMSLVEAASQLEAIEAAKTLRTQLLATRTGEELSSSSADLIHQAREERTETL